MRVAQAFFVVAGLFNIAAVEAPDSIRETQVVFNVGDDETRAIVVRFEPSERD